MAQIETDRVRVRGSDGKIYEAVEVTTQLKGRRLSGEAISTIGMKGWQLLPDRRALIVQDNGTFTDLYHRLFTRL